MVITVFMSIPSIVQSATMMGSHFLVLTLVIQKKIKPTSSEVFIVVRKKKCARAELAH